MNTAGNHLIGVIITALLIFATSAMPVEGLEPTMSSEQPKTPTTLEQAIAAKLDVYGEVAMRQPNGASYEFFADLIPPIRYCSAEFGHYPITLGMPGGEHKARLVGDGSAINARANCSPIWHETGFPVMFDVGDGDAFGKDLSRLDGPRYSLGYLPIVENVYRTRTATYREEVFAGVSAPFGEHVGCFVRFGLTDGDAGSIVAKVCAEGDVTRSGALLIDATGKALVWFSSNWKWDSKTHELSAGLSSARDAYLVVFTQPAEFSPKASLTAATYQAERARCVRFWEATLNTGCIVETPEPRVNQCLKALQIGSLLVRKGNMMNYSAANQYERLFEAECVDSTLSLLLFGHVRNTKEVLPPLMEYLQTGIEFHDMAFKLQTLSQFYWLTRDADFVRSQKQHWTAALDRILNGLDPKTGLLPREDYCGDIQTKIFSLNSNANSWRGLRDFSAVLEDIGEKETAAKVSGKARDYRKAILDAVDKSVRKDVDPPFVPIALFGEEEPYETLTHVHMGGYWNLMIPYVLGSGVLGNDSEQTGWAIDYLHRHGGIFMGMIRFVCSTTDDLYGLRYVLTLLRRDETDRALVSFYGKMAHGFTQDTYFGGETVGLVPATPFGRYGHLPPNSSSNALWLYNLRYLMVQDWDMDEDGRPDTLRLMFATPRRWLEDGKTITVKQLPTAFGEVSVRMVSRVEQGEVLAQVTLPADAPKQTLLRARLPEGFVATSAKAGSKTLAVDDRGTVDITGLRGKITVRFVVESTQQSGMRDRGALADNRMLVGVDDAGSKKPLFEDPSAISAFEQIGFDFLVHHIHGEMTSEEFGRAEQWANKYKRSYFMNLENSSAARALCASPLYKKPGGFFRPSKESVAEFSASPQFLGVIYDEAEHWSTNGVSVTMGETRFLPHFYDAEGGTLEQAYEGNVHNTRTLMNDSYPGLADNARKPGSYPIVGTENVFPIMQHIFAEAGMVQMPKLLKETMTPVTIAMTMGAAKQYGVRYWTSIDLWGTTGYPSHAPEELRSALLFSYWTGAENTYIENLAYKDSLYSVENGEAKLSAYGKVAQSFINEYLPAHTRSISFGDFAPEIIIVRFEDTSWGQLERQYWIRPWLYGTSNLSRDEQTDYWLKIWNVVSHGVIPPTGLNWNTSIDIPFRFFIPSNNTAVYDHTASNPQLYEAAKLVFLTGKTISTECMATLKKLVKRGLTVVTTADLAPKGMTLRADAAYAEYKSGLGKWIVTDDVTDPSVKAMLAPFLGNPEEMRYVFGTTEVIFTAPKDHGSIEVKFRKID